MILLRSGIAILLSGHAGSVLEVAVERSMVGKALLVGNMLEGLVGIGLNHLFGERDHVLLYPLRGRDAA